MGKVLTDEDIKLNIIVNGNEAQKEMSDLEKSTRRLNEENKQLNLQRKLLEKQGKKDTEQYKLLTKTIKDNADAITANKNRMSELQKEIGITGLTIKQLTEKARLLRIQLSNAVPGGEAIQRYKTELREVQERIAELRGNAQQTGFSLESLADNFNRYQALAISFIAALTGIVLSVQKIIDINGKLSDAQADVMKTTRMSKEEVDALTKSFGLLKTRTERIELLNIAKVAGELNIAKDEVFDFVRVMDKAGVALGDSFEGGAEEVATKLGKIKNLYDELKDASVETSFEAVGSALNDLGADGNATANNVADFVQRVGNIPEGLRPSIQTALGLGAAFEESGLNAEIAGNNYGKLLRIAARDFPVFAKVMRISANEAKNLLNTDPTEFFLRFSESIKGMDATALANLLDKLKLNDNEVQMVLGAASKNTDLFRKKIDLANKSMNEATSLTDEFNIKNNNLQATLDKISKKVNGWFSSESFNNWLFDMVNGFSRLIGATDDVDGSSKKWRNTLVFTAKILAVVTSALITNVAWQKLVAMWTIRNTQASILYTIASKARAFAEGVTLVATSALAIGTNLLAGNTAAATTSFRLMTAALMTTPWGLILSIIAAVGSAYVLFSEEAEQAATAQSLMAENAQKTQALVDKESAQFLTLVSVIQDTTASTEARSAALVKAKAIGGEYTKGLTLENAATFEGKKMIDAYIQSLEKKMKMQVLEKNQLDILEKQAELEKKTSADYNSATDKFFINLWSKLGIKTKFLKDRSEVEAEVRKILKMQKDNIKRIINTETGEIIRYSNKEFGDMVDYLMVQSGLKEKENQLRELQKQYNFNEQEMRDFLKNNPDVTVIDPNNFVGADPNALPDKADKKKDPNSTQEELNRIRLENDKAFNDAFLKNKRQLEDDRVAAMQEGYEKELAIENLRYQREIEDLERQKVHTEELAKMDEDISKAKKEGDITKFNALTEIRKQWGERNIEIDAQINQIIEGKQALHNIKLATIEEKAASAAIEKKKQEFEDQKIIRETQFNKEYAALGDNEIAKANLKRSFERKEIQIQQEFLEGLVNDFKKIIAKENFQGIDLSLLSDEDVKKFQADVDKVKKLLSELGLKKDELKSKNLKSNATALGLKGDTDIFGFTQENWEQFFNNLKTGENAVNSIIFAFQALTGIFDSYNKIQTQSDNAKLKKYERDNNKQKEVYKKRLDQGLISQEQYNKRIEALDRELDKKKAQIELAAAKRQRVIDLSNAITGTSLAVINALQTKPFYLGLIMASLAAAKGAMQIAAIKKNPLPSVSGYEDGLYPDYVRRSQDGKVFKTTGTSPMRSGLYNKPRVLVGEGPGDTPELVVSKKDLPQIDPRVRDAFMREISRVKGFENGYYDSVNKRYEVPAGNSNSSSDSNAIIIQQNTAVMSEMLELMTAIKKEGLEAKVNANNMTNQREWLKGYKKYTDTIEKQTK